MKVLVTGGAGFIAHHVIETILDTTDWEIISLDRLDFSGNLNRLHDLIGQRPDKVRVKIVYHDLKAPISPLTASTIGQVDYILHLAAGSHVDRSIDFPLEFVMDNVVGTANILDYARTQHNLKRFIYFSTDEVFGPAPGKIKYDEYDRYNSSNPYSASKAGGEELAVAYQNTYNLPIYITHTMNVFGERQHPEKYIPLVIRKVINGEKITIHSNPSKTKAGSRHYIHAKDVADGLMFLINKNVDIEVSNGIKCPKFNLVGTEEVDNLELAQLIASKLNKELKYEMVDFHSSRPGHDLRYALSGERLKELGWEPTVKLSDHIEKVVNWYINNPDWLTLEV